MAAIVKHGNQITLLRTIRVKKNAVVIISNDVMESGIEKGRRTQRVPCKHESTSVLCDQIFRNSL